ncbi:MAG TPA: YciI family protein [Rhodothermales bacterium]
MKYVCLCYEDEVGARVTVPVEDDDELRSGGHLLAAEIVSPRPEVTTVRVRNGEVAVTDGPTSDSDDRLGRFVLIDARDLNDAIRLASRLPSAKTGRVEIRRVR